MNVTGSIASSTVTVSGGTLQGSGTVGPVAAIAGNINSYSLGNPTTTQVLTINGDLNETGSITHDFQIGTVNDASRFQVNGNVTLNGVVTGSYQLGTYTLLNYTGIRSGSWTTSIDGATINNDDINKKVTMTIGVVVTNNVSYDWIGASGLYWNTASNWNPAVIPNSEPSVANISEVAGTTGTIRMSTKATLNKLNFNSPTTQWNINDPSGYSYGGLTFSGTNAQINGSVPFTTGGLAGGNIGVTVTLLRDIINNNPTGGGVGYSGGISAIGRTINQTGSGSAYISSISSNVIGGNYNFSGGLLNLFGPSLGGSGGMTINYTNTVPNSLLALSYLNLANPIVLNDTGANNFALSSSDPTYLFTGPVSGNLQHQLTLDSVNFSGNLNLLTWTNAGSLAIRGTSGPTTLQGTTTLTLSQTIPISIGDGNFSLNTGAGDVFFYNTTGTVANPISINPSTVSPGIYSLQGGAGATFSGGIVLNANQSSVSGNTFAWNGVSPGTISGVISNAATNASNITVKVSGLGALTLSNTNTYTSPTIVSGIGSLLNVTGSIGSSAVNVGVGGTLYGSGTVGAVTATGNINAYSLVSPATSQILTINGNLSESGSVSHGFYVDSSGNSSKIQVNGNVTLSGSVSQNSFQYGTFTLLNYTGSTSGSWSTSISGGSIINDTAGKRILLTVINPNILGWVGVTNGLWSVASNWSPQVVPNSTTVAASISNTSGS